MIIFSYQNLFASEMLYLFILTNNLQGIYYMYNNLILMGSAFFSLLISRSVIIWISRGQLVNSWMIFYEGLLGVTSLDKIIIQSMLYIMQFVEYAHFLFDLCALLKVSADKSDKSTHFHLKSPVMIFKALHGYFCFAYYFYWRGQLITTLKFRTYYISLSFSSYS